MQENEKTNMKEADDSVKGKLMPPPQDDVNYAKFSSQYANALVRFHHASADGTRPADNGFWFGRLMDYGYELQNFDNDPTPRDGLYFWGRLVGNELKIPSFVLTSISAYRLVTLPDGVTRGAEVDVKGTINYEVNGQRYSAGVELTHTLRPTWVAVKTVYTLWTRKSKSE